MAIRDQNKALRNGVSDGELCSAMVRLSSLALSKTDPDRVISEALREIRKTLRARMCWMLLVEENKTILKSLGDAASRRGPAGSELLLKLSPKILKRTYPIICNRVGRLYKQNRALHGFLRERGIHKFMGVPLKKGGRSIGVLNVGRGRDPKDFTREDLKSLAMLGSVLVISRLRAAEIESKRAQSFLGGIVDNTPNPIFIKDRKHRYVVLNQAFSELLGHSRQEMLGKSDYDIFPKDQADFFRKKDEEMFRSSKVVDIPEEPVTGKDGNLRWVHTKKAPLRDSSGKLTHLVGIIEDITERKRAEEALKESEERFRLMAETSLDYNFQTDKNGTTVYCSPAIERVLGYTPEERQGMDFSSIILPSEVSKAQALFRRVMEGEAVQNLEISLRHKSGKAVALEVSVVPIYKNKEVTGLYGIARDITERKQAEEDLRESESRYRALFEGAAEGIIVADAKTRELLYANPAVCRTLGYTQGELTRMSVPDIHPKETLKRVISKFEAQARGEKTLVPDLPFLRKDGTVVYADVNTATVMIDRRMCNVGFFTDTTERRQIGTALIQKERVARERARVLAELHQLDQIDDILTRVCRAVRNSGLFERAVMTLHEPEGRICHIGEVGLPADAVRRARRAAPMDRKLKERITSKKFRISDSFFIPSEAGLDFSKTGRYVPQKKSKFTGGDWQPGDELFVPLRDFSRKIMGFLSVDTPTDGCRPDIKTIEALEMLVEAAASRVREVEAQEALQQERDFSQSILETANSLIVCLDADAKITVFNQECERITGYRSEEVIGKRWPELCLPPDHHHFKLKSFVKWVRAHPSDRYEGPIVTKSGEIRTILWSNTAILGPEENEIVAIAIGHDITERKRADEEIRKFKTISDRAGYGSAISDLKGNLIYVNEASAHMHGYDPENLLGKHLSVFHNKEQMKDVSRLKRQLEEKGRYVAEEVWHTRKDGVVFPTLMTATVIKDGGGQPLFLSATMIDITERNRAEEALQKSEDRYRSLFEDSPISLWEEDFSQVKKYIDRLRDSGTKDFRRYFETHPKAVAKCASLVKVIDVNKASLRLYKARNKEDLKSGLGKIFARESYYPFTEELIAIAEGRTHFEKEADARTLRGDSRHVSVTWSVAPGHEETLSKTVVAITDVTEAKEAEEALRRSEEMHRTLVETAQEGIGIVDSKENLVFVNRAFAGLLGYRKNELLGKNLKEISDSKQYDVFREETKKRKQGQPSKYEITLLTKRGKPKPMYVSAAPLRNPDGSFRGTLGVVSDLTEIKKAREYNILLGASRSLSRTLKFDQVLKLGAEKMAQALNADRCAVMLPEDDASGSAVPVNVYTFPNKSKDAFPAWNLKVPKEHLSSYKRSLQARGSIQIFDVRTDLAPELGKKIIRKTEMVSALVIPILLRNKMLGVFHVGMTKKARTFNTEEERLARTMANQAAAALQNCRLMEDVRKEHAQIIEQALLLSTQFREQKVLYELTQTLSSPRGLDHLLKSATKKVGELVKTERSSIALLDPEGKSVSIRAAHIRGKPLKTDLIGWTFRFEDSPQLIEMVHKGKPFMVNDTSILAQGHPARKYLLGRGIKSTLAVPLLYRGKCLGFLTVATTTEVHRYTKEEIRLLQTISNSIAVTIENYRLLEDLKQKYAQIRQQTRSLEKQTREKDILLKVSRALSRTMDLDEVGRVASQVVGSTLGVERCAITFVTKENYELTVKGLYSRDRTQDRKIIGTKFVWNDIPDMCNMIKRRKPFIIHKTSDVYPEGKTKEYFLKAGIKSVLGTGMFFGDKLVGILSITSTTKHRTFSQEEVELVQTLANQIGVAIENARLQQVVEKHAQDLKDLYSQLLKTQENERKRITQELHDQVGQMLQSMKMNLDWMKRGLMSKPQKLERMEDWLLDTEKLLGQTIDDIRNMTFELRPSMLDDFGLIPALRWYIDNYGRRSSIRVSLKTKNKEYRFPPEVVITLYRIIQEVLTNVAKHSGATEASVSVSQKGSTAILSVRDNGIGFDLNKALLVPKGMGLLNIKERVDMLGGNFEIISRPRKGTKLNIQIPFSGGAV
ncbi:MAG: PAS domain S-box protein [Candidatus Zixiibacteriota bacterium]